MISLQAIDTAYFKYSSRPYLSYNNRLKLLMYEIFFFLEEEEEEEGEEEEEEEKEEEEEEA